MCKCHSKARKFALIVPLFSHNHAASFLEHVSAAQAEGAALSKIMLLPSFFVIPLQIKGVIIKQPRIIEHHSNHLNNIFIYFLYS